MSHLKNTVSVYCDGGVISRNPSSQGGTYAFFFVDASDQEIAHADGYVLPQDASPIGDEDWWSCNLETISNNVTELAAVVFALQQLPAGFAGTLYSDSHVTLCRMRHAKSWNGVPDSLKKATLIERERHPNINYVLLDGHPTKEQLKAKIGKRGNPCSPWNVKCDERCGELAKAFLAHKSTQETE